MLGSHGSLVYSNIGLISILKANNLVSGVAILNDLLSGQSLPVACSTMLLTRVPHRRSLVIVTPKYLY